MIKNMKVETRLLVAFLLVTVLSGVAAGIGMVPMSSMNAQAEHAYADDLLARQVKEQVQ